MKPPEANRLALVLIDERQEWWVTLDQKWVVGFAGADAHGGGSNRSGLDAKTERGEALSPVDGF